MGYLGFVRKMKAAFAVITVLITAQSIALQTAQANEFMQIFDKELHVFEEIPLETYNAKAKLFEKSPLGDAALRYEIRLPKVWKVSKVFAHKLSDDIYTDIGRYEGPVKFNKASSYLTVKAIEVGLQASAKTMAIAHFMSQGYSVLGAKAYSRNHIETIHIEVDNGESYAVRSVFLMNGGRLIMASYYLPQSSFNEEKGQQYRAIESFKLINKVEAKVDSFKTHEFWDLATFNYPSTLITRSSGNQSFDRMDVTLFNQEKTQGIKGIISIDLISRYNLPKLEGAITQKFDELEAQGIIIKEAKAQEPLTPPKQFKNFTAHTYDILYSQMPTQETELTVIGAQALGYYYIISMITPTKASKFKIWGENSEALNFILETLQANEDF